MDERDHMSAKASAGLVVDEFCAAVSQLRERCGEVVDLERDVVESRSASLQEPGEAAVGVDRLDQLDVAVAGGQADRLDPLIVEPLTDLDGHSIPVGVDRKGRIDVLDGVGDMMDSIQTHTPSLPPDAGSGRAGHAPAAAATIPDRPS